MMRVNYDHMHASQQRRDSGEKLVINYLGALIRGSQLNPRGWGRGVHQLQDL